MGNCGCFAGMAPAPEPASPAKDLRVQVPEAPKDGSAGSAAVSAAVSPGVSAAVSSAPAGQGRKGSNLRADAPEFRPSKSPPLRPGAAAFVPAHSPGLQPSALPFVPGRAAHVGSPDLTAMNMNAAAHAAFVPLLDGGLGDSAMAGPRCVFGGPQTRGGQAKLKGAGIEWQVQGNEKVTSPVFSVVGLRAWAGKGAGKASYQGDVPLELVYAPGTGGGGPQVTLQTVGGDQRKKAIKVRLKFEIKVGSSSSGSKAIMAPRFDVSFPAGAAGAQTVLFTPIELIR